MSAIEIKNYTILERIGYGGSGRVYLAKHNEMDRPVAIKIVQCDTQENEGARCIQEAKILSKINHPNVISIYDSGSLVIDGKNHYYLVLEYLEKGSLETKVTEGKFTGELEIWRFIKGVCQGLQIAVEHDVLHRNIKPSNILISKTGQAKIGDFSIAKMLKANTNLTEKGYVLGSPSFIAPETAKWGKNTFKSDIYALGLTAYFCLTKKIPFDSENIIATLVSHMNDRIAAPIIHNSDLTLSSNLIIAKMIQKKPEDRYTSYGDLLTDIENLLHKLPLEFATVDDSQRIYDEQSVQCLSQKAPHTSAFKKLMNFIVGNTVSFDNIIITGFWDSSKRQQQKLEHTHYIKSLIEIEYFLHQHLQEKNVVVIDIDYQQDNSVVIFDLVRTKFPQTSLVFSAEKIVAGSEMEILCAHDHLISDINIRKPQKALDICLSEVAKLANMYSWNVDLKIEEGEIRGFRIANQTTRDKISMPTDDIDS